MKYKLESKTFKTGEDIDIPDNATAIRIEGVNIPCGKRNGFDCVERGIEISYLIPKPG
jgi:hypothetical protein